MFCQFFVSNIEAAAAGKGKKQLSCQMYQRSCDLGLGVPFNIASYALLTHMIAQVTDCEAKELVLSMGDAHVYKDHVEPLKSECSTISRLRWSCVLTFANPFTAQLDRQPYPFPKLEFKRSVADIDDFKYDDFEIVGYKCHGKIDMKMSV